MDYMFDTYADDVIAGHPEHFDGIEVQGVHGEGDEVEVDNDNPDFYSVYVHYKPGSAPPELEGVQCVGDFSEREQAQSFAADLSKKHGWPVSDYTRAPSAA